MLPCHIVRDLLPSYLEHLTGPETEADICEHLESCPDCRAARDAMAADLKAEKAPPPAKSAWPPYFTAADRPKAWSSALMVPPTAHRLL